MVAMATTTADTGDEAVDADAAVDADEPALEPQTDTSDDPPEPNAAGAAAGDGSYHVTAALVLGAVLVAVGVMGPIVGGTDGPLLGFGRNLLLDVLYLASGLAGVAAGYVAHGRHAATYTRWMGVGYLLVAVLGFVATGTTTDLLNVNLAASLLHLTLAVVFLGVGFTLDEDAPSA
jgi:hypothetical protein